jgi:hypothetical protein
LLLLAFSSSSRQPVQPFRTMEVANLEAAFERITVTDENNEQVASSITSYHKAKV